MMHSNDARQKVTMNNEIPKPNWWALFTLLPLFVIVLFGEAQLDMPPTGHRIAQAAIVVAFVGLLGLWQTTNAYALLYDDLPNMRENFDLAGEQQDDDPDLDNLLLPVVPPVTATPSLSTSRSSAHNAPGRFHMKRNH